jgi:hypothetical protein
MADRRAGYDPCGVMSSGRSRTAACIGNLLAVTVVPPGYDAINLG